MPRPGPRPYECVRRAWHSDRHQPMRGSLIQEIFRVANEVHSPATRKNKEWQEKLPLVVLKAEEIMYSKANSEAEYMDLKTLWDRANDAINTIIRREDDDTPESRDLLQPCIEAALNLGCMPRRASRSQRHSNPGFYLSSSMKEATATSPKIPDNSLAQLGSSTQLFPSPPPRPNNLPSCSSQFASWYSALATPITTNSGCSKAASVTPDISHEQKNSFPFSHNELPFLSNDSLFSCQDGSLSIPLGTCTWSSLGRVYPLYYSASQPKTCSPLTPQNLQDSISKTATMALPCVPSIGEFKTCFLQNFLDRNTTMVASNINFNFGESSEYPPDSGCDLSLRLGPPSPPYLGSECAWTRAVEDVGSSSSCDASKLCGLSLSRARVINFESSLSSPENRGFDFFHLDNTDEPLDSCSSKGSSEGEGAFSAEASDRKQKSRIGGSFGDGYICRKQKIPRDQLLSRKEAPES